MGYVAIAYGMGYVFFCLMWGDEPPTRFYNKLLGNRVFANHFIINLYISLIALHECIEGDHGCAFFFMPLFFLPLLRLCNYLTRSKINRELYIAVKGDRVRRRYGSWDTLMLMLVLMVPMFLCICIMEHFRL